MPKLERHWTVNDLEELPNDGNRYEVLDGELLVTPAPSLRHQEALAELHARVRDYLTRERVGHAFFAPADVMFSRSRSVQPDLFVVPLVGDRRPERFEAAGRLLLAVEVISPSTARVDRVAKRVVYREERVSEYWIVDVESCTIERSTPADARVDVLHDRIEWRPEGSSTPLAIDIPEYFRLVLNG